MFGVFGGRISLGPFSSREEERGRGIEGEREISRKERRVSSIPDYAGHLGGE